MWVKKIKNNQPIKLELQFQTIMPRQAFVIRNNGGFKISRLSLIEHVHYKANLLLLLVGSKILMHFPAFVEAAVRARVGIVGKW